MTTIETAAATANFGQASALKNGRDPRWPYVPVILWPERPRGWQQQIKGVAFATREEAIAFAERTISHRRECLRLKLADPRYRALRVQHGLSA